MAKLHELLAVEGNLTSQATKVRTEAAATFEKKRHLFSEKRVTFTPAEEGKATVTEEQSDIQSTVKKELDWLTGILSKAIDAGHQIDLANTEAIADVVIEGDTDPLLKAVPTTSLLRLEKRLEEIRQLAEKLPTLDPAKGFAQDTDREKGIFKAREVRRNRTQKTKKVYVKYPATKEHPAQTELLDEDIPIGELLTQEWAAMPTPAQKSDSLERCDMLIRAVKKARAKANDIDIQQESARIGKKILEYVFQPLA